MSEDTIKTFTLPDPPPNLAGIIVEIAKQTHAGSAILTAAVVEEWLQKMLLAKMQPLSNTLAERLFEGYGPLGSYSGKIDICFALALISEDVYRDLRIIKDIRNEFAHSVQFTHFRSEEIIKLLKKFRQWDGVVDPFALFGQRVDYCIEQIKARLDGLIFANALAGPSEPPA